MVTILEDSICATSFARIEAFVRQVSDKNDYLVLIRLVKATPLLVSLSCSIYQPERLRQNLSVVEQGANCQHSRVDYPNFARGSLRVSTL